MYLFYSRMREFTFANKILKSPKLHDFYCAELLAEIYSVAAKALGFHGDCEFTYNTYLYI